MTARRGLALAGVALALVLVTGRVAAGMYADWAWYGALGAGALWSTRVAALTTLRAGLFALAFGFALVNLLVMRRSIVSLVMPRRLGNLEIGEAIPGGVLTGIAAMLSAAIAAIVAFPQDDWLTLVRAFWARPIGEMDPYLGRDMAFWMGWLPFERGLHEWCVTLAVVVGMAVLMLYALTPSVRMTRAGVQVSTWVRRHFALYSAVLLLLVAWGYRLDAFDLLIHGSGTREAFVAFDHLVMYPYLLALGVGTAAVGILVAWTGWAGHQRTTISALLLVLIAGPVLRLLLPVLDGRAATERERAALDRPYQNTRILYTRRAYAVDDIIRGESADSVRLPSAAVALSASGWDPAALARAMADEPGVVAVQGATTWGSGAEGALRAAIVLGSAGLDAGRAAGAVQYANPADAGYRGAPVPSPDGAVPSVPPLTVGLDLPRVLVVHDTLGRVAAPAFVAGWRRVALAWSVRDFRLSLSEADPRYARLLLRRDVRDRVQALLPFFSTGGTPQALLVGDSLWWAVELFNASADYPLSEPISVDGVAARYAVAAGVALVNAHSGRVMAVLGERPDRVTRWWRDRLPSLFVKRSQVAPELLLALPAPVDRAMVQGTALALTGFRRDTLAAHPLFQADDADPDLLPGAPTPFISAAAGRPLAWGVPVVDGVDHLRGVFVAVGGVRSRTVLIEAPDTARWTGVLGQLQRSADSAHFSRSLRHPRRGRVQVVPTTDGMAVLQSFYDWPPEREPMLAGVVALRAGQARSGSSLASALGAPGLAATADATLRLRLARSYADLRDALRREDWIAFGRAMDTLRRLASERF